MAFQTPITIKDALTSIGMREYVLPAIQRELVWKPRQIEMLFDSLMRDYPIGAFLFWKVRPDHANKYRFYEFVTNYHEKKPHNRPVDGTFGAPGFTAVLDGQQRLTALNIGFRGSYAAKLPRLWWNNPDAFPPRFLYLNLRRPPDENEDGLQYDFRFLTPDRAKERTSETYWYRVSQILKVGDSTDLIDFVHDEDLASTKGPQKLLTRLHQIVHSKGVISFYEEKSQDLHKVLNIFVRTNSGGTVLSYSDMLLSVATAQWDRYDAREEIHRFVDEINAIGHRFAFNKDFVLKACLMLSDIDTKFRVTNFNSTNMSRIQDEWVEIRKSVYRTVQFAAGVGYDAGTLTATNSLLPVAYYLHHNKCTDAWLTSVSFLDDRKRVRRWLIRALLKKGIWGSGLDTLLAGLRNALREPSHRFPIETIERDMERRGKNLAFGEEELEDISDIRFGDPRVYGVLVLLYPFVDVTKSQFHIDHIFPRAKLSRTALVKAGVPTDEVPQIAERTNGLANLQLLSGPENVSKSATLPSEWLARHYKDDHAGRRYYEEQHDLAGLPEDIAEFPAFYDRRRQTMLGKLRSLLAVRTSQATG